MRIGNTFNSQIPEIKQKQPSFGSATSLSEKLLSGGALRKFADTIEFDGPSMNVPSILGLFVWMVGFRIKDSYDKYDKQEILRRDVTCLTTLMFMARALAKGFSEICQNKTGFVLNQKPEGFDKLGTKIWAYINPLSGFSPLGNAQITPKYSKIDEFKNGIVDFCEFINKKGGNINKVLAFDNTVKTNTEKILEKSLESASYDEIVKGFNKAKGSPALKEIYEVFKSPNNPFVKRAKTMNSIFGFVSTFILTPALIIWIAKSNEKMTKKRIAKEAVEKEAQKNNQAGVQKPVSSNEPIFLKRA